jgi:hypothetical protein
MDNRIEKVIRKKTHRIWNKEISRLLCRAYSDRKINSEQLHNLTAMFDPTRPNNQVNGNG